MACLQSLSIRLNALLDWNECWKHCRAKEANMLQYVTWAQDYMFICSSTLNVLHVGWHLGTWQVNLRGGGEFGPDWERAGRFATGRLKAYEAGNTWTLEKNMFHSCWYCSYIWYVLGVFMSAPWFKVGLIGRFDYKPVQVISEWDALELWHLLAFNPM